MTWKNSANNMPYTSEICPSVEIMDIIKISTISEKKKNTQKKPPNQK